MAPTCNPRTAEVDTGGSWGLLEASLIYMESSKLVRDLPSKDGWVMPEEQPQGCLHLPLFTCASCAHARHTCTHTVIHA